MSYDSRISQFDGNSNGALSTIPAELKNYRQWVLWRFEIREGKQTKIPYQINGMNADSTDAATWTDYDKVVRAYFMGSFDGIGFVITPTDKFCGVDMDHCRNPETGEIDTEKLNCIKLFNSYTEITPSKTGIRVWIKAKLPENSRKRNDHKHIGIYDQKRFFTVTGNHLEGTPSTIESRQKELEQIYTELFPTAKAESVKKPTTNMDIADTDLTNKAMLSKNGPSFSKLWNGNTSEYDNDDSRV